MVAGQATYPLNKRQAHSSVRYLPVSPLLLPLFHTPHEAAGEEGHGHEQNDGRADNGCHHSHPEAKGLVRRHGCKEKAMVLVSRIT